MAYLLTQMFLYLLVCFLLGLLLGWLIWRYLRPSTDTSALEADRDRLRAELDACRARGAELEAEAGQLRGEAAQLERDLSDCRAARAETNGASVAAPVAAASVMAAPEVFEGEASKPEGLSGPRGGVADNLQRIHGIGPKLEKLLHSLGYYHFDQIASWTDAELAWVDQHLDGFYGRASRDRWVPQAAEFTRG